MGTPQINVADLGFFALIAGVAALAAVGVVAFQNAVRSALSLVVNFFMLAFLYFTLNCEMLGITQVVVYTGAIMVLFLFVIMLLNLGVPHVLFERRDVKWIGGGLFGLALLAVVGTQVMKPLMDVTQVRAASNFGSPQQVGLTLFSDYLYPFEIVSILLLIGIVGSIVLAKRRIQ
ncbi:MAG TPA: NADH-quinone oxidoreductase subunit J [Fimbriimonadaceae bacterium]|nr:NADH-quinone oxidoreductase subunit J [Fimbriimonadaceae bacterium]